MQRLVCAGRGPAEGAHARQLQHDEQHDEPGAGREGELHRGGGCGVKRAAVVCSSWQRGWAQLGAQLNLENIYSLPNSNIPGFQRGNVGGYVGSLF